MFVDGAGSDSGQNTSSASDSVSDLDLDLSNAIPGHLIAYEDIENDLLLAGDLNWQYVYAIIWTCYISIF
jgi:hypothetical protein